MSALFKQSCKIVGTWRLTLIQFTILIIPIALLGCAPKAKFDVSVQPAWVTGASQQYALTQYFVGKAHASALDVAAKNARTALAETLPELSSQQSSTSLSQLSQTAEVVDAWFDKTNQKHYALVVLERAAAIKLLRQQLTSVNAETQQWIRSATQGLDPIAQIQATHKALASQPQRADLLLALQTLGDNATADASVWSVTELQVHLKSLLSNIDVRPLASVNRQLDSAVVRGLEAAGYLSTRSAASFELKTSLRRSGMKWEQGRFTEHGTLFVELIDGNQQVRSKAEWPLKAHAHERALLEKELMGMVKTTLETEFANTVMGFVSEAAGEQLN